MPHQERGIRLAPVRGGSQIRSVRLEKQAVAGNVAHELRNALPVRVLFRPGNAARKGNIPAAVKESPRLGDAVRPTMYDPAIPIGIPDATERSLKSVAGVHNHGKNVSFRHVELRVEEFFLARDVGRPGPIVR